MMIFCRMNHQKRNVTRLSKALEFPQLISMEFPNTVALQKGKLKKILNVYKVDISAAYNDSDIEIEELSPIYDGDTNSKAEEPDRQHAAMKEKLVTASNTD